MLIYHWLLRKLDQIYHWLLRKLDQPELKKAYHFNLCERSNDSKQPRDGGARASSEGAGRSSERVGGRNGQERDSAKGHVIAWPGGRYLKEMM